MGMDKNVLPPDRDWLTGDDIAKLSRPDSAKGVLQRALLRQIRSHEDDGMLPTNARFLFYELEGLGFVSKDVPPRFDGKKGRRPDGNLQDALTHLREKGLVRWSDIEDETRELTRWRTAETVADYVMESVEYARVNPWGDEPAPLILCESRSLAGVLEAVARRYACPIASTNGMAKGFLINEVAPQLRPGQRVLYLGDWDFCGGQIEAHTRKVLEEFATQWRRNAEVWERVALTAEQVEELDLPVISKLDGRTKKYAPAVETEALGQRLITDLLTARLDALMPEPLADVLERDEVQRAAVRAALADIDFGGEQ